MKATEAGRSWGLSVKNKNGDTPGRILLRAMRAVKHEEQKEDDEKGKDKEKSRDKDTLRQEEELLQSLGLPLPLPASSSSFSLQIASGMGFFPVV